MQTMIGISSKSAGILLIPRCKQRDFKALNILEGCEEDADSVRYAYSAVQDWEEIEALDASALLEAASREYWLSRTVSYLRLTIGGLERSLERRSLEHIEEMLSGRVDSEMVLARLLVAPLKVPTLPQRPARMAVSYGFGATASILEELADLQPLLQRFTDIWLSIDNAVFDNFVERKEDIWTALVEKDKIRSFLNIETRQDFISEWNLLAFDFAHHQSRSGVTILARELAERLYPGQEEPEKDTTAINKPESSDHKECVNESYQEHQRVKKEVESIIDAISQGQDSRAQRYLDQLIQRQTAQPSGEDYAVKSLCNIAQRCADLYRTDFEAICLDRARHLNRCDSWMLIQYGDHLKRTGRYEGAVSAFSRAEQFGVGENVVVARSSIADVYSQTGDYIKAINTYKSISNWNNNPTILSAIADNLRKMGQLDDAQKAYQELIDLEQQGMPGFSGTTTRAQVGMAEIAKRQGRLSSALNIYRAVLGQHNIDERDRNVYQLGLCNILKLMGEFDEAYNIVDKIIQIYPFSMEARFLRWSILGLMGRAQDGLNDVTGTITSPSYQEWLRRYCQGLMLLKLQRYDDAKKNLVEVLQGSIATGEHKSILAMASALCCLGKDDISEADKILSQLPDLTDCYTQYLLLVLKLHTAVLKKDQEMINYLMICIGDLPGVDTNLNEAVKALHRKEFSLALGHEADAILRLAA